MLFITLALQLMAFLIPTESVVCVSMCGPGLLCNKVLIINTSKYTEPQLPNSRSPVAVSNTLSVRSVLAGFMS